ncbi:hypothetical protein GJAV_G00243300 [Gymnothorax javanicus]|nr:hypothetical protein GJAV_G00243300 [Gymnothorax javanicus]
MYLERCAKMNNRMSFMSEFKPETLSSVVIVEDKSKKYTCVDLVRTPNIRKLALYTGFVWLRMGDSETVTDYLIRAEDAISALKDVGEDMSEGLCIAMILEGLPEFFKPLAVHVTQNEDSLTFTDFKRRLRNYEEAERRSAAGSMYNVMKTATRQGRTSTKTPGNNKREETASVTCYRCRRKGHKAKSCTRKVWCSYCKRDNPAESMCRRKGQDDARRVIDEDEEVDDQDHVFKAKHQLKLSLQG